MELYYRSSSLIYLWMHIDDFVTVIPAIRNANTVSLTRSIDSSDLVGQDHLLWKKTSEAARAPTSVHTHSLHSRIVSVS